jgi:L-ascorbate metabolism protein UlaG (beta-lactamase superfamily)
MKITWFGHSAFRIDTARSALLIDPFLSGNPVFKGDAAAAARGATHVALTHGHDDHLGDAAAICNANGATLIAVFELAMHIGKQGVKKLEPANTGGTVAAEDFEITFVQALHSSSSGNVYLGNPCGLVVRCKSETHTIYHMGDTAIFGDMALINRIHKPDIGLVPIGDRFTMNPETAALACREFFDFKLIVPCHYGTFAGMIVPDASGFERAMGDRKHVVKILPIGGSVELPQ